MAPMIGCEYLAVCSHEFRGAQICADFYEFWEPIARRSHQGRNSRRRRLRRDHPLPDVRVIRATMRLGCTRG